MNKINIFSKDFNLSESNEEYIIKKMNKIQNLIGDTIINITVKMEGKQDSIEIYSDFKGKHLKIKETGTDFYEITDIVSEKFERKVKELTDKLYDKSNKTHLAQAIMSNEKDIPKKKDIKGKIVKRKIFDMKPMFEEDAILMMESLNHPTFMFYNIETESYCMIYRRNEGSYGVIQGVQY